MQGLIPTIEELFPNSEPRFYVRHIHTNFKKNYRCKALKDQLWTYDKASYIPSFEKTIDDLKVMSTGTYQYMKNIDPNIGIDVTSKLNSYVTCF